MIKLRGYKGAGVALFKKAGEDSFVLLGKRKYNPNKCCWSFFGGGNEKGETLIETALREFREESGVVLDESIISKQKEIDFTLPLFKWKTLLIEITKDIELVESAYKTEFSEMKWVNIKDIENYELNPFVKTVVKKYSKGI